MARSAIKWTGSNPWGINQVVTATEMNNIGNNLDAALNGIRHIYSLPTELSITATTQTPIPSFTTSKTSKGGYVWLTASLLTNIPAGSSSYIGFWYQTPSSGVNFIGSSGFISSTISTTVSFQYLLQPVTGELWNYGIWTSKTGAGTMTIMSGSTFTIIEI